ncbi:MAG TPA: hypothetical protein VGE62_01235 [Candidatus Paceibacterota bacterium]
MKEIKKILSATLILTLISAAGFTMIEPSVSEAQTASDTVVITLNVTTGISITAPADSSMSTALGVAQDTAVGTTTWNVKTNNAAGYTLALRASTSPAMQATTTGNTIPDYGTATTTTWNVTSGNSAFGYSVFGTGVSTGAWGTGSTCASGGAHIPSTTLKYKGFTTSDFTVMTRTSTTTTTGIDTTVCYAVEQDTFYIPSGTYQATITATATAS